MHRYSLESKPKLFAYLVKQDLCSRIPGYGQLGLRTKTLRLQYLNLNAVHIPPTAFTIVDTGSNDWLANLNGTLNNV